MIRRIAVTAPLRASPDEVGDAIGARGVSIFPEAVQVDEDAGFAVAEKVTVNVNRLAAHTWAVEISPVGHRRWLPAFDGRMTIARIVGDGVQLVLKGTYRPPLGWIGAVADHVAGGRIARRSIGRFLHAAAVEIDREVRRQRESRPMAVAPYPPDLRSRAR